MIEAKFDDKDIIVDRNLWEALFPDYDIIISDMEAQCAFFVGGYLYHAFTRYGSNMLWVVNENGYNMNYDIDTASIEEANGLKLDLDKTLSNDTRQVFRAYFKD